MRPALLFHQHILVPIVSLLSHWGSSPIHATMHPNGDPVDVTGFSAWGVDNYWGIPFAEAPVKELRFARPVPKVFGSAITAVDIPRACMQVDGFMAGFAGVSEDCLTLNVMAPAGTPANASLPVMVWIYGGGFQMGSASLYNTPFLVRRSAASDRPILYITINYRVGVLGWGGGKEIADAGAANLGLYDQQLALRWIHDNIASFGGDPSKVTIFGESAGAISASLLMLDKNNHHFRSAILQSGGPSTIATAPTAKSWQEPFDKLVEFAGCSESKDIIECLRTVPADELQAATAKMKAIRKFRRPFVFSPTIDGDIIPASPHELLDKGHFARKPFITGSNKDEATVMIPQELYIQMAPDKLVQHMYPSTFPPGVMDALFKQYPEDLALGCPWGTGNETWGHDPSFKQISGLFTDAWFQSARRQLIRQYNKHGYTNTWSYEFEGAPKPMSPAWHGTPHAAEVVFVPMGLTRMLWFSAPNVALAKTMMDYWINFAYYMDPNGAATTQDLGDIASQIGAEFIEDQAVFQASAEGNALGLPNWTRHDLRKNKDSLLLKPGDVRIIQDDFREERMAVFDDPRVIKAMDK